MAATDKEIIDMLKRYGIIVEGHRSFGFERCADYFIDKEMTLSESDDVSKACLTIAEYYVGLELHAHAVVSSPHFPVLSRLTVWHMTSLYGQTVNNVRTVKNNHVYKILDEDQGHVRGKNVLVVSCILNTTASSSGITQAVKSVGGNVASVAFLCNFGANNPESYTGFPTHCFSNIKPQYWKGNNCPYCQSSKKTT